MNRRKYLDWIQAIEKNEGTLNYVSYLQKQHVLNVHFENVDSMNKKPLSLSQETLIIEQVKMLVEYG